MAIERKPPKRKSSRPAVGDVRRQRVAKKKMIARGKQGISPEILAKTAIGLTKMARNFSRAELFQKANQVNRRMAVKNSLDRMGVLGSAKRQRIHAITETLVKRLAAVGTRPTWFKDVIVVEQVGLLKAEFGSTAKADKFVSAFLKTTAEMREMSGKA